MGFKRRPGGHRCSGGPTLPAGHVVGRQKGAYTLLSVMDMESSVSASLDISLSLGAGASGT